LKQSRSVRIESGSADVPRTPRSKNTMTRRCTVRTREYWKRGKSCVRSKDAKGQDVAPATDWPDKVPTQPPAEALLCSCGAPSHSQSLVLGLPIRFVNVSHSGRSITRRSPSFASPAETGIHVRNTGMVFLEQVSGSSTSSNDPASLSDPRSASAVMAAFMLNLQHLLPSQPLN